MSKFLQLYADVINAEQIGTIKFFCHTGTKDDEKLVPLKSITVDCDTFTPRPNHYYFFQVKSKTGETLTGLIYSPKSGDLDWLSFKQEIYCFVEELFRPSPQVEMMRDLKPVLDEILQSFRPSPSPASGFRPGAGYDTYSGFDRGPVFYTDDEGLNTAAAADFAPPPGPISEWGTPLPFVTGWVLGDTMENGTQCQYYAINGEPFAILYQSEINKWKFSGTDVDGKAFAGMEDSENMAKQNAEALIMGSGIDTAAPVETKPVRLHKVGMFTTLHVNGNPVGVVVPCHESGNQNSNYAPPIIGWRWEIDAPGVHMKSHVLKTEVMANRALIGAIRVANIYPEVTDWTPELWGDAVWDTGASLTPTDKPELIPDSQNETLPS